MELYVKVGLVVLVAMDCTGCMVLAGTPGGYRAYGDMTNGYITNGKATADKTTAHWKLRTAEVKRESILESLFKTHNPIPTVPDQTSQSSLGLVETGGKGES